MDLFLNELSLGYRSFDRADAIRRMNFIVDVISKYAQHGGGGTLRTLPNFLACALTEGYTIRHWLNDNSVRLEKRTRFKTAATKGPFVEEWIKRGEETGAVLYEFHFGADPVYGLGAGYLFESPTVSLPGDTRFEVDPVTIRVTTMDAQRLVTEEEQVCSFTNSEQVTNRVRWVQERIGRDILDHCHPVERGCAC
jgi:hypothetical protein